MCLVAQSCSTLCNPWTGACQAPLFMEFSRQEYWSRLPFPSPGDLPKPGIEPRSLTLQADFLPSESPGKPPNYSNTMIINISVPFFQSIPMKYYNSTISYIIEYSVYLVSKKSTRLGGILKIFELQEGRAYL